jgi:hypothetical protein
MVEAEVRHAGARLQQIGGAVQRASDDQRRRRFAERCHFASGRSAERQRRTVLIDQMPVERITDIGQHQRRRPKASIQVLIASMSPGVSIDEASTLTCLRRAPDQ